MKITDEAVEEAAKAIYEYDVQPGDWVWSKVRNERWLARGRAALEAGLPHLGGAMPADMDAPDQLAAEVEPWLRECGACDAALPMSCTCPPGDYRSILLKVWRAYEALIGGAQ